jgi:signal transduction histidine kinase
LTYPFYVIDANDYTIKLTNSAAYKGELPENTTCYMLTHKRDKPCDGTNDPCPLSEVKRTKKPVIVEHIHFDKNNKPRNVEVHVFPIFDNQGDFSQVIEYSLDITDRKRSEEEIRVKSEQLQVSNQKLIVNEKEREKLLKTLSSKNDELQSIVYIASHDLKSPLVNINGFSSMLDQNCKDITEILKSLDLSDEVSQRVLPLIDEDIPESIKFISASTHKIKMLLDGLLEVSRVGVMDINIEPLDMSSIINNVCQTMEFQTKEKGIELDFDGLPNCLGDEKMIDQLLSNLVGNALKYMDPDRKGKIDISGTVDGAQSIYCIQDNGVGIAPEHHSKVFELFHRLNLDDSVEGEGLGLTIVARILGRNNGNIWVESEEGKGSNFFVSLPTS